MEIWVYNPLFHMEIQVHNTLGSNLGNCNKYLGIKTRVGTCTLVTYMAGSMCSKCSICSHFNHPPKNNCNCNGNSRINLPSGRQLVDN